MQQRVNLDGSLDLEGGDRVFSTLSSTSTFVRRNAAPNTGTFASTPLPSTNTNNSAVTIASPADLGSLSSLRWPSGIVDSSGTVSPDTNVGTTPAAARTPTPSSSSAAPRLFVPLWGKGTSTKSISLTKNVAVAFVTVLIILLILLFNCNYGGGSNGIHHNTEQRTSTQQPQKEHYSHPRWRPTESFVDARTVYESKWVAIEEHTVQVDDTSSFASDKESGINTKTNTVKKWLWVNQPDQINVLVYLGQAGELAHVLHPSSTQGEEEGQKRKKVSESDATSMSSYTALADVPVLTSSNQRTYPTFRNWLLAEDTKGREGEESANNQQRLFLMFRQRKYGYEGSSLAVVGGAVDIADNNTASVAAQRELHEELGIVDCPLIKSPSSSKRQGLIHLGGYRTDTNRGGGVVYTFVASRCPLAKGASFVAKTPTTTKRSPSSPPLTSPSLPAHRLPTVIMQSTDGDLETQPVVIVTQDFLTETMLNQQSDNGGGMQGSVKEVKWVATVALSMLRLAGLYL